MMRSHLLSDVLSNVFPDDDADDDESGSGGVGGGVGGVRLSELQSSEARAEASLLIARCAASSSDASSDRVRTAELFMSAPGGLELAARVAVDETKGGVGCADSDTLTRVGDVLFELTEHIPTLGLASDLITRGAVPALVAMSGHPSTQRRACMALAALATNVETCERVVAAGAVVGLVDVIASVSSHPSHCVTHHFVYVLELEVDPSLVHCTASEGARHCPPRHLYHFGFAL
jgi:hypothetical protein